MRRDARAASTVQPMTVGGVQRTGVVVGPLGDAGIDAPLRTDHGPALSGDTVAVP